MPQAAAGRNAALPLRGVAGTAPGSSCTSQSGDEAQIQRGSPGSSSGAGRLHLAPSPAPCRPSGAAREPGSTLLARQREDRPPAAELAPGLVLTAPCFAACSGPGSDGCPVPVLQNCRCRSHGSRCRAGLNPGPPRGCPVAAAPSCLACGAPGASWWVPSLVLSGSVPQARPRRAACTGLRSVCRACACPGSLPASEVSSGRIPQAASSRGCRTARGRAARASRTLTD